ncbi:hypothetical protein BX661DRAFT_169707 [Kickxella alabastrina]|uniref:uncharacterized protein n=1 Tax=Kickxella alabastrina TaxID=61397 RepID=UPI00221E8CC5|nr:uncharacterized protein BX661DRAFT_169707 [Kickxella alabastrina]KAI7831840.1 hypothetical protein BX661DRAFT_169707 [Kickxella alabastrina]
MCEDSQSDERIDIGLETKSIGSASVGRTFSWQKEKVATLDEAIAHFFGPNFVVTSPEMDAHTEAGHGAFIGLIVNWSFCSEDQLGYDSQRVAMSPIGKPLNMLKSVPELIIVVADAMCAHRAIVEHCHILHRDVMPGNILFQRMNDGTIKERSQLPRTELDDWETLIYVLIWIETYGFKGANGRAAKIKYWVDGTTLKDIASYKRGDLDSSSSFKSILNQFDIRVDRINVLAGLLSMMRNILIDNAGCKKTMATAVGQPEDMEVDVEVENRELSLYPHAD